MQEEQAFNVTFLVDNTPQEVFDAINNVRGWWSQSVEGETDKLGAVFNYHFRDVHRCSIQITEFVPDQKVAWHVLDNYFNFVKDKSEWIGTDLVFEIAPKGDKTEVRFTHIGLVPAYECYAICTNAWGVYIGSSLRNLIVTGEGQPNPIEEVVSQADEMRKQYYATVFAVDNSPEEVFAAITNVRGWWSDDFEGRTDELGAEFEVHFEDIHHSTQKITELIPGEKVVWHVLHSRLNFVADKAEWAGTDIVFVINRQGDKTELHFQHVGLVPALECYSACSDAWSVYIKQSLFNLITKGKGQPTLKDKATA